MPSLRVPAADEAGAPQRYAPPHAGETAAFCWAINLDRKHPELELFPFKKYSSFTFLDPLRCLFGVTLPESLGQRAESLAESQPRSHTSFAESTPRRESQSKTPLRQSALEMSHPTPTRDEELVTSARTKTESVWSNSPKIGLNTLPGKRYSIADRQQTSQQSRPTTSREHGHESALGGGVRESWKRAGSSIQAVSQYARSSYGQKPRPEHTRQSQSSQMEQPVIRGRKPDGSVERTSSHHDNFYKRVQEILRK